jgi:transcription elongation GreA/GreB family factor
MKLSIIKNSWTRVEAQGHPSGKAEPDVFLDFDPVFPGWPPEDVAEAAADEPQKGESNARQHSDHGRRFSAAEGHDPSCAPNRRHGTYVNALEREFRRANIMPSSEVPSDLVTMNSRVGLSDAQGGGRDLLTLVYPHIANGYLGFVSRHLRAGNGNLPTHVGDVLPARTTEGLRFFQAGNNPLPARSRGRTRICDAISPSLRGTKRLCIQPQ